MLVEASPENTELVSTKSDTWSRSFPRLLLTRCASCAAYSIRTTGQIRGRSYRFTPAGSGTRSPQHGDYRLRRDRSSGERRQSYAPENRRSRQLVVGRPAGEGDKNAFPRRRFGRGELCAG